jgi:hypothetical protein
MHRVKMGVRLESEASGDIKGVLTGLAPVITNDELGLVYEVTTARRNSSARKSCWSLTNSLTEIEFDFQRQFCRRRSSNCTPLRVLPKPPRGGIL